MFHRSPVRRAFTFLLDKKSKQKNQDAPFIEGPYPHSLTAQTVERHICTWLKPYLRCCCCKYVLLYLPVVCTTATLLYLSCSNSRKSPFEEGRGMIIVHRAPSPVLGVGALFKRGGPGWGKSTWPIPLQQQQQNSPPLTRRGRGGWTRYSGRYRYRVKLLRTSKSAFHRNTGIWISPAVCFRTWMSGRAFT